MMSIITITVWAESVTGMAVVQPGVSLWGSFGSSLGSWFSLCGSLSIVAQMMSIIPSITQTMTIIAVAIRMSSIAKTVIVQPGVSLWVRLSISLSSGLGLSLLYGLDSLLLSGGGGGHSRDQTVGKDSVSAGDGGTLIVLTADWGCVDEGVVYGVGVPISQRKVACSVDKPGIGLGLSSSIGGNS